MNQTQYTPNPIQLPDEDGIDVKNILFKFLRNWYWFVLCLVLTLGAAFVFLRYATPVYRVSSTMLVEEGEVESPLLGGTQGATGEIFQGLGVVNSMRNIANQIVVLRSTPIVSKTLKELDFEVSYYSVGRFASIERYRDVPFRVVWDRSHPQLIETDFNVHIAPNGSINVGVDGEDCREYSYLENRVIKVLPTVEFSKEIQAGMKLVADEFAFSLVLNERFDPKGISNYKFRFHTPSSLVNLYRDRLYIDLPNTGASIIELILSETNVWKGRDFLNKLTEVYQLDNLDKKNENANRTIQFIDRQLQNISDSLNVSENRMETFQSKNQVVNISMQSQQMLEQMNDLDKEKVALETQNKYYKYLKDYVESTSGQETAIAPSAMGIQDPLLNSLILQLNDLITQKSSQTSIVSNSQHPMILRLNAQIESVKKSLLENTSSIISQSDMALEDLNKRIRTFESQVRRLPATERNYVNIERAYRLTSETYTFLLQKLSEAQIAKASNVSDSQVIEEAGMIGYGPVSPDRNRIYALAFLLGLAFPALLIFLLDLLNTKVKSEADVKAISKFPIIGHVFNNAKNGTTRTLMLDQPNSPATEPYRAIRNKLNLMTKGKAHPVIAVSSTFPKEGKSYNTINVASSFALSRKKTVILDLDLRNSKISEEFDLKSELGVVNYIIGKADLEDITFSTKHPNLKIIPAGPIPPNPAEMITDERMFSLLEILKEKYDVVLIDTPPVGYVADMFQLNELIDANLFVVRHKYTYKLGLKNALEEISKHQLKAVSLIINDIKLGKKSYGYDVGYGAGYGYGYGYGKDQKNSKRKHLKLEDE